MKSREFIEKYWNTKLEKTKNNLEKNNFDAYIVQTEYNARELVINTLLPELKPSSVSFGGSMTVVESGIYDALKSMKDLKIVDTYDTSLPPGERIDRRRQSLLVDLYITGTNAVTEDGVLVNLDGVGNRVAAITFGPRNVIIVVGRNKIVPDIEAAMMRIKEYAAPVNAIRLSRKTPCVKTSECEDCSSPDRICNVWSIVEKSAPAKRIKVVLVNKDLGF